MLAMKGTRSSCPVITREAAARILRGIAKKKVNVRVPSPGLIYD